MPPSWRAVPITLSRGMWLSASGASRRAARVAGIGGFLPKLEELVERSKGKIRADVAHEKITATG
jgi:hypothetical protein